MIMLIKDGPIAMSGPYVDRRGVGQIIYFSYKNVLEAFSKTLPPPLPPHPFSIR